MAEPTRSSWNYVWVKDKAGNEYACPVETLKKRSEMTEEELKNCTEDATRAMPVGD